jgi:hypothetical protein
MMIHGDKSSYQDQCQYYRYPLVIAMVPCGAYACKILPVVIIFAHRWFFGCLISLFLLEVPVICNSRLRHRFIYSSNFQENPALITNKTFPIITMSRSIPFSSVGWLPFANHVISQNLQGCHRYSIHSTSHNH